MDAPTQASPAGLTQTSTAVIAAAGDDDGPVHRRLIRATLPRVRVDQLMAICWKYLVPVSFLNVLAAAVWVAIFPNGNRIVEFGMFLVGAALVVLFFRRVWQHMRRARLRELGHFSLNPIV